MGFQMAKFMTESKKFKKLCVMVDKNYEGVKELEKMGCHVEEIEFKKMDKSECQEHFAKCVKKHDVKYLIMKPKSEFFLPHMVPGFVKAWEMAGKRENIIMCTPSSWDLGGQKLKDFEEAERCVKAMKTNVIMRLPMCMENLEIFRHELIEKKRWLLPLGEGKTAFISGCDVVKAIHHLTQEEKLPEEFRGELGTLTSRDIVNGHDLANVSSTAFNDDVKFDSCSDEELRKQIERYNKELKSRACQIDRMEFEYMVEWFQLCKDNKLNYATEFFEKICKTQAMGLKEFFERNKDHFHGRDQM